MKQIIKFSEFILVAIFITRFTSFICYSPATPRYVFNIRDNFLISTLDNQIGVIQKTSRIFSCGFFPLAVDSYVAFAINKTSKPRLVFNYHSICRSLSKSRFHGNRLNL